MTKSILVLISVISLAGCLEDDSSSNCDSQISDLKADWGQPEEINRYDSGDYHSHNYWYWCKGYQRSFTWGEYTDGCEVSEYTFSPICSN